MAAKPLPDQATLLKLLRYEPETGNLFWRERSPTFFTLPRLHITWNKRFAGQLACTLDPIGYQKVRIFGQQYLAHRIIWKMVTGDDPCVVDHIDGLRSNNTFANLRSIEPGENSRNMSVRAKSESGCVGVTRLGNGKWWACIRDTRVGYVNLGTFADLNDAVMARKAAERRFGYHPNHGKRRKNQASTMPRSGLRERDHQIIEARRQGKTYRAIGLMFDLDFSRVRRICIKESA